VLIDVHAHFLHDRSPRLDWRERNASRLRAGERVGITVHVASILGSWGATSPIYFPSPADIEYGNDFLLALQRTHSPRVRGYVVVNPNFQSHALTELARCLDAGMIGIKLAASRRADDPLLDPICQVAQDRGIVVVPLQVVIGATVYDEGPDGATPEMVAEALRAFRPVSTSRPSPALLTEVYAKAAQDGATEILSIHLSAEMSGTHESAQLAARDAPVPVTVVDSRQVGVATGYAALSAADVLDAGGTVADAATAARARAGAATALFYVDTLEYLRRGGRIGAAAALLGGALSVKPLLRIDEGRVVNLDRVRTSARALSSPNRSRSPNPSARYCSG